MDNGGQKYSIDTSSLIHAWHRAYPPSRFASVWAAIDTLIEDGRLLASIEVYKELQKKDDDIAEWAKDRKQELVVEIDEESQAAVIALMASYPKLVDTAKGKSGADPFVIAIAQCHPENIAVVTQEQGGSTTKPKIPFVCQTEGIETINLLELIDREDWTF